MHSEAGLSYHTGTINHKSEAESRLSVLRKPPIRSVRSNKKQIIMKYKIQNFSVTYLSRFNLLVYVHITRHYIHVWSREDHKQCHYKACSTL